MRVTKVEQHNRGNAPSSRACSPGTRIASGVDLASLASMKRALRTAGWAKRSREPQKEIKPENNEEPGDPHREKDASSGPHCTGGIVNIYIVFYSERGHIYKLAKAVAEGARSVKGAKVKLFQTERLGAEKNVPSDNNVTWGKSFAQVPFISAWELAGADAVIFGTPAKFGMMAAPMRHLLDQTGPLWADGALLGKVGSVFTSTTILHGGQESTVTSFHATLLHLGMIIVGVPFCENRLLSVDGISGINPYGASIIAKAGEESLPNENELGIARFQGQHVAEVTRFLLLGRARSSRESPQ